ncbi:hypothetical protein O7605_03370 [Verrucosispora sp. WMMA2121]|uniref:hypothetical protein n=1 Tax=Verrucosispora sp. WMMA2121 TaxID=3015164 RepID=UPI0022B6A92F|nr:hypothetical protein [Verrucosispora sp. WMMA2121]MCZ7418557.1 hypothetical protein [Verrucosispora sp. WMMA2121]
MAKHRAPIGDRWSREEGGGGGVLGPAAGRTAPTSGNGRAGGWSAPRQDRSPNAAGGFGRDGAVGVASVPATSRLTPPGRDIRNQGPRPAPTRRPAVVPAPTGRHRRSAEAEC